MRVKYDFLNWRPDQAQHNHDGLEVATDVIHTTEGWVPVRMPTTTSFATELSFGTIATHVAIRAKPFGPDNTDLAIALIREGTVTTGSLHIGSRNSAMGQFTAVGLPTLASSRAAFIETFSVAELGQDVVIGAQARCSLASGGHTLIALNGTFTYTITSV